MKKIATLLTLFAFCFNATVFSQSLNWAAQIDAGNFDLPRELAIDSENNILMAGEFTEPIDLDPGTGAAILTPAGQRDIFVAKLDRQGNYLWAFNLESVTANPSIGDMLVDADDNFYLTGIFTNTTDFDPGTGVKNLIADDGNWFVAKYDQDANLLWVIQMGGSASNSSVIINDLDIDDEGHLYLGGAHTGLVYINDTDGGTHIFNNNSGSGYHDLFVAKIDANAGTLVWSYDTGGFEDDRAFGISVDSKGNVYAAGIFQGEVDFDWHNFNTFILEAAGNGDAFIMKLDSDGEFVWAGSYTSENTSTGQDVIVDSEDNIYIAGVWSGTTDFDMGPGVEEYMSFGTYITKIDSLGTLLWKTNMTKSIYGTQNHLMSIDENDNIYHTGNFTDNVSVFDIVEVKYFKVNSAGSSDVFVSKLEPNGKLAALQRIGGIGADKGQDIEVDAEGNIVVLGSFRNTVDFDIGGDVLHLTANGVDDIFISHFNGNCFSFYGEINEVNQVLCNEEGRAVATALGGTPPYSYVWNTTPPTTDSIAFFQNIGNYEVTISDNAGCERVVGFALGGTDDTAFDDHDFTGNLIATDFRTGFSSIVWLDVFNKHCVPTDGQVKLLPHFLLEYINADPAPDAISGDTLIWERSALSFDTTHFTPEIIFKVSQNAAIGDTVNLSLLITPTNGDVNVDDNLKTYYFPIINSYDPNDKKVFPSRCEENYITQNELLTYTVRFQNTGNAEAIHVNILDTLESNLDINTVRVVGYSHPVITEIWENHILNFRFDNILLPDSLTNEPKSHGYIVFEIRPKPNLDIGTTLQNRAAIYFDFNPPVITNTIVNTVIDDLPNCFPVNASELIADPFQIKLFPNPSNDLLQLTIDNQQKEYQLSIYDNMGKLVFEKAFKEEQAIINIDHLMSGVYSAQILLDGKVFVKRFVKMD